MPNSAELLVYESFRRRIVDEDNLINNRTSWQLGLQTILVVLWAAIVSGSEVGGRLEHFLPLKGVLVFICVVGLIAGAIGLTTIMAAHREIKTAKADYKGQYPSLYSDVGIPKMTGNTNSHNFGHLIPLGIPVAFALVQFLLLLSSLYVPYTGT
jgi:hypothetical protein